MGKAINVLEVAIDAGETYVGYPVQGPQLLHHQLTDEGTGDLGAAQTFHLALYSDHEAIDVLYGDGTLGASQKHSCVHLLATEYLAATIMLGNQKGGRLDLLHGGEALAAEVALSPTTDALRSVAGVYDSNVRMVAVRAVHGFLSWAPPLSPRQERRRGNTTTYSIAVAR